MARVSVVVPCSSQKDALKATVDSILAQTYDDFELLVADDGSTDGTGLEMLAHLGPDPTRAERVWLDSLQEETGTRYIQMIRGPILIHYLHQVLSRGVGAARNRAVTRTVGEYIAFAEPGDIWHKKKLAVQIDVLDTHRDLHALIGPKNPPSGRPSSPRRKPVPQLVEFEETVHPPGLSLSGAVLRRSCLGWDAPFDENLPACEDFDFWLRLGSRYQIARLGEHLQSTGPGKPKTGWSLDRYRVYALEKSFQSGHLTPTQRYRVAEVLVDRCGRLAQGYRQRENLERSNFYERKRKRFVTEVEKLDVSDPLFTGRKGSGRRLSEATT